MNDIRIFMNYRRLRSIKRCNTLPTVTSEDVAQHSYYVAVLAMVIGDEYNTYVDEHNLGFHPLDCENWMELVNMEVLLRKALLHDTEEAITGDIPWNIKHMNEKFHESITKAISDRIDKAYDGAKTMEIYHKLGTECKEQLEGQFVDLADMLELGIYSWEEVSMGNMAMMPMLKKAIKLTENFTQSSVLKQASPLFNSIINLIKSTPGSMQLEDCFDIN